MKKIINSKVFIFILGLVVMQVVNTLAYSFNAKDAIYTPSNTNWNVNNISDAIDDLKANKSLFFTKTNVESSDGDRASRTATKSLTKGRYILSVTTSASYISYASWTRENINNGDNPISISTNCSDSNANISLIGNYYLARSSSGVWNNAHSDIQTENSLFYVEIKADSATFSASVTHNNPPSYETNSVSIIASKIN